MAMLRGWRRQRANLIFAPLAMPLPLLPADPLPSFPSRLTVCVSLTHNSHALFIPLSHSPIICVGRYPRFSISSILAYFITQSVHTTGYSLSLYLCLSLSLSLAAVPRYSRPRSPRTAPLLPRHGSSLSLPRSLSLISAAPANRGHLCI